MLPKIQLKWDPPAPIPVYDYTVLITSLLFKYQLQRGNKSLHESLASCPSADNVDRNMYFTINMAPEYHLQMNFPEAVPVEEFTSKFTDSEPNFSVTLQDLPDPASNLQSVPKRTKLLKDLMLQIKHFQQEFPIREQGLSKL